MTDADVNVPIFKKKGKASNAKRRVVTAHEDSTSNATSSVVKLSRKSGANPLIQSTGGYAKRRRLEEEAEDDLLEQQEREESVRVKFSSTGDITGSKAAAQPQSKDSTLVYEGAGDTAPSDGLYHGLSKTAFQLPTGSSRFGAVKGPDNIRNITLVDYQPDVCKDYKETGWCGYGDSCKFLHDRGDYMHGWELDNAYLSNQPKAVQKTEEEIVELPFACLICREPFTDPIVTKCGHYFCSACAIKRFSKTPKCFACGAATGGIFNKATRILERKQKLQDEKLKRMREEEGDMGEVDEQLDGIEGLAEHGEPQEE